MFEIFCQQKKKTKLICSFDITFVDVLYNAKRKNETSEKHETG